MKQTNHEIQQDQGLYDMLVETRQAMTFGKSDEKIDLPDVEEEWKKLSSLSEKTSISSKKTDHQPSFSLRHFLKPHAAAIIGFFFLAGISFAAIHYLSKENNRQRIEYHPSTLNKTIKPVAKKRQTLVVNPMQAEPVVFQDVELQKILETIADYYKVHVEYRNASARKVRFYLQWDKEEGLDAIVGKLNHFEKVHITLNSEENLLIIK